jgi:hypothetical protein
VSGTATHLASAAESEASVIPGIPTIASRAAVAIPGIFIEAAQHDKDAAPRVPQQNSAPETKPGSASTRITSQTAPARTNPTRNDPTFDLIRNRITKPRDQLFP